MARGLLVPMIGNAVGYGLFLGGAWLLWRGLVSEAVYERRLVAKTPWPLKTVGGGLIGLGTGLTAWLGVGHHPGIAFAFGLVALLGCRLFYGVDPGAAKRVTAASGLDTTDQVLVGPRRKPSARSLRWSNRAATSDNPSSISDCGASPRSPARS